MNLTVAYILWRGDAESITIVCSSGRHKSQSMNQTIHSPHSMKMDSQWQSLQQSKSARMHQRHSTLSTSISNTNAMCCVVVAYHSIGVGETTKVSGCLVDVQLKRVVSSFSAVLSHIGDLLISNRETNKRLKYKKIRGVDKKQWRYCARQFP